MRIAAIIPGGPIRRAGKKKKGKPAVVIPGGPIVRAPKRRRAAKPKKARKIVHPRPRTVAA